MKRLIVIPVLMLMACNEKLPNRKALIESYYAEKVAKLEEEQQEICKEEVIALVKSHIDSIIDTRVNAALIDSLQFPDKPNKPAKPEAIIDKFQRFTLDSLDR